MGSGVVEVCNFRSERLALVPLALGQFLLLALHPCFPIAGQVTDN